MSKDRGVWGGGVNIDILLEDGTDNVRLYELKVTSGRVVDLYQLIAGLGDGLVKEGINPTLGVFGMPRVSRYPQCRGIRGQ